MIWIILTTKSKQINELKLSLYSSEIQQFCYLKSVMDFSKRSKQDKIQPKFYLLRIFNTKISCSSWRYKLNKILITKFKNQQNTPKVYKSFFLVLFPYQQKT